MGEKIKDLKEELRIAEANGNAQRAEAIRKKLQQQTVNG
jgi:hypothetical protein